jgi:hypothetical protein
MQRSEAKRSEAKERSERRVRGQIGPGREGLV